MLIKKIILRNIRSYENQEIEFPEGSVLLSGDIGSGKTSVLLGIEFALFGLQPGQRGASLLRNGKNEGGVIIEFEVDGKNIILERTLKKSKTISQDYCSITIDDEKKEISVTELKDKVLELLNYPKEFSKKQNVLYKFTVYTPQEDMKQIILQDAETRLNTLRHVFGIDRYKKILENISIVSSKMREEKRIKEALIANLEQDKKNIVVKKEEIQLKRVNLVVAEEEYFEKKEARKKVQGRKDEIYKNIEEKNKLQQEVEKTKLVIANKRNLISDSNKSSDDLKKQIAELRMHAFDESRITELERKIIVNKKEKEKLNETILEVNSQINSLKLKNDESEKVEKRISGFKSCPTCLQDVDAVYRANVLNKLHTDCVENNKKIEKLMQEKLEILSKIKSINSELNSNEKKFGDLRILKIRLDGISEKQTRADELEKSNKSLESDIALLENHTTLLKNSIFELGKFDAKFEAIQVELDEILKKERFAEIKVAELKKEIEVFSNQIEEMERRIKKTEKIKDELNYLSELENWLSKKFTTMILHIEKNVLIKLESKFSKLFAEWFAMLVSESFNVRLRDDFTPIIEQQDYEIDYSYLSGGERTAVALAYRLALNQVINSMLSKIKTRDIVILDEPTDGFSEQQLDKMRDVLQELDVKQLIIVSHEQKIEGFVENVIRFKKDGGVSRMET